jgi:hypothetical protein
VERLSIMMPRTVRTLPLRTIKVKYPRSKSGPERTPMMISRKDCVVPIQDIADGEEVGRRWML